MLKKGGKTIKTINFILNFFNDEILYWAASLSFYTIFSFIPILFIFLSLSLFLPNFIGLYINIKEFIFINFIPINVDLISNYLDTFLKNIAGLGLLSFIYIIFTVIFFLKTYEKVVLKITKTNPRSFLNLITTYWLLPVLSPVFLMLSFYFSEYLIKYLNFFKGVDEIIALISSFILIWILFLFIFKLSLNETINEKQLLFSSFITAFAWYLLKNTFVYYVMYNNFNSIIYGPFNTILLFFLWINFSWCILLYGLKLYKTLEKHQILK